MYNIQIDNKLQRNNYSEKLDGKTKIWVNYKNKLVPNKVCALK